jgi:hypothetical protein
MVILYFAQAMVQYFSVQVSSYLPCIPECIYLNASSSFEWTVDDSVARDCQTSTYFLNFPDADYSVLIDLTLVIFSCLNPILVC